MAMVDPSKWTGNWGSGVRSSGVKWSSGMVAAVPTMGAKAAAAAPIWQAAVADPAAARAYADGERNFDQTAAIATINGAGQTKYTAAGTTKQAGYASFVSIYAPKLSSQLSTLNSTSPRGPRGSAQNQQRMIAFNNWIISTRGTNQSPSF
jgi:ABC-type enterobactin transport system permease subunit